MNADNDKDDTGSAGGGGGAASAAAEQHINPLIRENRGQRKSRKIKIINYACNDIADNDERLSELESGGGAAVMAHPGLLPSSSRETTPLDGDEEKAADDDDDDNKAFFSGNPFVEVTHGIIHMYKKNDRVEIKEGLSRTLCLFSVPATLNCHDILNFVAPCHPTLKHIRIIRDGTPNQFMVLLEFRLVDSAMEFYETFNGAPYNSLEPDSLCHAVWVSNIEWSHNGLPPLGHTELPTCPVCLERMDESVDGILTILCNHAFHANCLIKWGDSTCPVCRCVQTPELAESSVCMECEGTEGLWICLICGHIGCGRYQGAHASSHFRSTNHTYALQLGSNRVWDYAGDNFVHRLLQSKSDGKLVATDSPPTSGGDGDEKIDGIQLEFTYLLTSQLDAQRKYYEEKMARLESLIEAKGRNVSAQVDTLTAKCSAFESKLTEVTKEKATIEKKHAHLNTKVTSLIKDLAEERQLSRAMQSNQTSWQCKYAALEQKHEALATEKEAVIVELKDEIRDLMFYMEAQNTIAKSDLREEIEASSASVPPPPPVTSDSDSTPAKNKNRRKKK